MKLKLGLLGACALGVSFAFANAANAGFCEDYCQAKFEMCVAQGTSYVVCGERYNNCIATRCGGSFAGQQATWGARPD